MTDETDTTSEVARVLLLHASFKASQGIQEPDAPWWWECDGCDTKVSQSGTGRNDTFSGLAKHQAAMLAEAGVLREATDSAEPCNQVASMDYYRDGQVDPYWIRCNAIGPHVEHEDANTGLTWTTDDPEQAQIATQEPAGEPGVNSAERGASGGLGERLRDLVAEPDPEESQYESVDVAALVGLADEAHRLEVHARVVEQSLRTSRAEGDGARIKAEQWKARYEETRGELRVVNGMFARTEEQIHEAGGFDDRIVDLEFEGAGGVKQRVQDLAQWFRGQGLVGYARKVEEAVDGTAPEPVSENPFRMPEDRA